MKPSRPRRRAVTVLVLVLVLQGWGLYPRASGAAIPRTVARTVGVPVASLFVRPAPGRLSVARPGMIRTAESVRTSRAIVCSPIWFTATALVWRQSSRGIVHAYLASGAARGRFGSAHALASDPDEAPDPGTAEYNPRRRTTDLLWTGGGRCIRFAMALPRGTDMANLRAVFVNTSGTAAGPNNGPAESPLAAAGLTGGAFAPQAADASPLQPPLVTREGWGANPRYFNTGSSGCAAPYYASQIKMAYIHHTAGSNSYSPGQSDDIVRAIYWFHTQERGYCDIAYNFLVDRYGKIFVGRAGGVTRPVVPGSQMGFNTYTFSVSTMGNWDTATPPDAMVQAVENLVSWRLDVAHIPPTGYTHMVSAGGSTTRYPAGTKVRLHVITGHRDTGLTACPGARFYPLLPGIRTTVNGIGGPKIYRPAESSEHVTPLKRPVTFTAWANRPITWRVSVTDPSGGAYMTMNTSGQGLDLAWNGTDGSGAPLPPGIYRVVIGGNGSSGAWARPAVLPMAVNPAPPPPSPSPTATS